MKIEKPQDCLDLENTLRAMNKATFNDMKLLEVLALARATGNLADTIKEHKDQQTPKPIVARQGKKNVKKPKK